MAIDGISRLVAVTRLQSSDASGEALTGTTQQGSSLSRSKSQASTQKTFQHLARVEQQRAVLELEQRLRAFRLTLSPGAAALLDQWLDRAGQHR